MKIFQSSEHLFRDDRDSDTDDVDEGTNAIPNVSSPSQEEPESMVRHTRKSCRPPATKKITIDIGENLNTSPRTLTPTKPPKTSLAWKTPVQPLSARKNQLVNNFVKKSMTNVLIISLIDVDSNPVWDLLYFYILNIQHGMTEWLVTWLKAAPWAMQARILFENIFFSFQQTF